MGTPWIVTSVAEPVVTLAYDEPLPGVYAPASTATSTTHLRYVTRAQFEIDCERLREDARMREAEDRGNQEALGE